MTNATTVSPEQLLESEPKFHQGLKTPMRPEGNRTITYTWTIGEGQKWRDNPNELTTFKAQLYITHNKGRGASYSATLWQHQLDADGCEGTLIDGSNGLRIHTDFNRAGRFSLNKLQAFAPYALAVLRSKFDDPAVLAYFKPERV